VSADNNPFFSFRLLYWYRLIYCQSGNPWACVPGITPLLERACELLLRMLMENPPRFITYHTFGGFLRGEGAGDPGWGCAGCRHATISVTVGVI